jgi:hypothetical protein
LLLLQIRLIEALPLWAIRGSIPLVASKVRGMIVKGMGKSVFRFIPLTTIPLTLNATKGI